MKQQSVLIVTSEFPPQPGGIGDHAYNLAYYLERSGYRVTVLADCRSDDGREEQRFDAGLSFTVVRIPMSKRRFTMYLQRIRLYKELLQETNIVLASGKFSLWNVGFASGRFKGKKIAIVHGTEVNFSNKILHASVNKALQQFSKIIAVSNFTKGLLSKPLQEKTVVIPNGFNPNKWESHPEVGVRLTGSPKLITVGHVSPRKGQQEVIKLLPALQEQFPDISYHCVGLPTGQQACETLAKELDVFERVFFHGRVSNDTLYALLQDSDVFVMLSTITGSGDVEGFGIALLEANALGLPTIGATGCGIEDAIDVGRSGFLVDLGDMEGFKQALQQCMNDKDRLAVSAKEWAAKHDWERIIERYVGVIGEVHSK
ncbi:glycosyltransferase family 4 protein [Formosa sp. A9]|uniref:glycosyltransferase family 4 protein n=1 Tax=Formosa sp. A9 TaxID=3442641 RepID=UPI003EB846B4